jgi:hypothetical protein
MEAATAEPLQGQPAAQSGASGGDAFASPRAASATNGHAATSAAPDAAASPATAAAAAASSPVAEKRASRWEPSERAEQLKREYTRAKRRRMRWGCGKAPPASAGAGAAPALEPAPSAPPPAETEEELVCRIDETNRLLLLPEASSGPTRARLLARRKGLVRCFCAVKFAGRTEEGPGAVTNVFVYACVYVCVCMHV